MEIKEKHEKMLYPTVRVRTDKAGGSGTVIYSEEDPLCEGQYETYVLTNNHVIASNVTVGKEWSTLLQREIKKDTFKECSVEFFDFEYGSWEGGSRTSKATIMCYHKEMDLALLKLQSGKKADYVATLFPHNEYKQRLRIFQKVFAVGCGLGHPTLATEGQLNGFDDMIDNHPYILSSAPTIYGNSGGSLYLAETGELIGVPSRIAVTAGMLGGSDAITHLSFSIPIWSVYKFLEDQIFDFIFKPEKTSATCVEERRRKRERDERQLAVDATKECEPDIQTDGFGLQ